MSHMVLMLYLVLLQFVKCIRYSKSQYILNNVQSVILTAKFGSVISDQE